MNSKIPVVTRRYYTPAELTVMASAARLKTGPTFTAAYRYLTGAEPNKSAAARNVAGTNRGRVRYAIDKMEQAYSKHFDDGRMRFSTSVSAVEALQLTKVLRGMRRG